MSTALGGRMSSATSASFHEATMRMASAMTMSSELRTRLSAAPTRAMRITETSLTKREMNVPVRSRTNTPSGSSETCAYSCARMSRSDVCSR